MFHLARAGTTADLMRVALTAISAMLSTVALLAAATVLAIRSGGPLGGDAGWSESDQYTSPLLREAGLRPGLAIALVLLTLPIIGLAAQCARLGAPERDRRLSAIRMAGASPGQAGLIAVAETGLAAALGAGLGLFAYLLGRTVAHRPDPVTGALPLPTDVRLPWWVYVVICAGTPLLAAALATVTLRRVTFGPFRVVRRVREKAPRPWPGVLIVLGVASFPLLSILMSRRESRLPAAVVLGVLALGAALGLLGLVIGTGWLTATTGRVLARAARRPTTLLAATRLIADPWSTARAYAGLLMVTAFGAGAAGVSATFDMDRKLNAAQNAAANRLLDGAYGDIAAVDPFYDRAFQIVYYAVAVGTAVAAAALLVSVAEAVVTRRRSYATLVATGVPRGVLARAALWQTIVPLAVGIPAALAVGAAMPLSLFGWPHRAGYQVESCVAPPGLDCADPATRSQYTRIAQIPAMTADLPIPWTALAAIGGLALLAALLATAVGLVVLGPSTRAGELRAT